MESKVKKERNHISILMLRRSDQWSGSSFLGDHFIAVERGRQLYVIVLFSVGSAYMVWCHLVLERGRQSLLTVLYRTLGC